MVVSTATEVYLEPEFQDYTPEKVEELNKLNQQSRPRSILQSANSNKTYLTPREYQYELFRRAVDQNIIAVLDTGAGKTLISVMLMKHMLAIENEKCQNDPNYKANKTSCCYNNTYFVANRYYLIEKSHILFGR